MIFPLKKRILTVPFWVKMYYSPHHLGCDYRCSYGTSLYAPASGKVYDTFTDARWGKFLVFIDSRGKYWRFAHLSEFRVKKFQKVKEGQLIGKTGGTSNQGGPHLHIDIWHNKPNMALMKKTWDKNLLLDPEKYIIVKPKEEEMQKLLSKGTKAAVYLVRNNIKIKVPSGKIAAEWFSSNWGKMIDKVTQPVIDKIPTKGELLSLNEMLSVKKDKNVLESKIGALEEELKLETKSKTSVLDKMVKATQDLEEMKQKYAELVKEKPKDKPVETPKKWWDKIKDWLNERIGK